MTVTVISSILRLNLDDRHDRNTLYLVLEILFAAILGAASTFNGAYSIRLGASNFEVSLLSSIPALMAVLVSLPAGQFLQSKANRKPWILGSLLLNRSVFILLALVPWFSPRFIQQGSIVVAVLVIMSIPAHFFNVGWIPLLADVIPEEHRAGLFAARNITYNIILSICVLLYGQWLVRVTFPRNYQAMYLLAFIAALVGQYFLMKVDVPISSSAPQKVSTKTSLTDRWHEFQFTAKEYTGFLHITRNTLLHGCGIWMAAPLYILYYVKQLNASDAWIGIQGTVASLATIAGYAFWRWVISHWGEQKTLKCTIIFLGLLPIFAGLLPNLNFILVAIGINGFLASGTNLSHINILIKVMPEDRRPGYTALYMTIMNIGAFICPMLGVSIANYIGLRDMLIVCGVLITLGSSSFILLPIYVKPRVAGNIISSPATNTISPK